MSLRTWHVRPTGSNQHALRSAWLGAAVAYSSSRRRIGCYYLPVVVAVRGCWAFSFGRLRRPESRVSTAVDLQLRARKMLHFDVY